MLVSSGMSDSNRLYLEKSIELLSIEINRKVNRFLNTYRDGVGYQVNVIFSEGFTPEVQDVACSLRLPIRVSFVFFIDDTECPFKSISAGAQKVLKHSIQKSIRDLSEKYRFLVDQPQLEESTV